MTKSCILIYVVIQFVKGARFFLSLLEAQTKLIRDTAIDRRLDASFLGKLLLEGNPDIPESMLADLNKVISH